MEQIGYIFEFLNYEEKVTLFAVNFLQAMQYIKGHPLFSTLEIVNISCFRPIIGVTEKNVMNGDFVWVGLKDSPDGWVNKNVFLNSKY